MALRDPTSLFLVAPLFRDVALPLPRHARILRCHTCQAAVVLGPVQADYTRAHQDEGWSLWCEACAVWQVQRGQSLTDAGAALTRRHPR